MGFLALLPVTRWFIAAGLVAGLMLGIYVLDRSRQALGYEKARAEYTEAALKASEQARAKEQELVAKNQKVSNDYQIEKQRRIADSRINASRLQELTNTLATNSDTATSSGIDDPRDAIINQCAGAIVGLDGYAQEMAGKAKGLQDYANNVCLSTKP